VMNGDGTMNEEAGPYAGMDRFECRKKILEDLEAAGLIEKIDEHQHAVGHCYRCDTVVEPRLSPQWFVRMAPLAAPALEAVNDGRVQFVPGRWTKVYQEWMGNIRDWCISRQIWWGHRIPVFYCDACGHEWAAKGQPEMCPMCAKTDIRQDEDVLDTWFSSWLWPFSTFGWPEDNEDLKFYYPTHDLVTASEIIFFWVARMVMAGMEFMGDIPFEKVYIHGTVRDDKGRKMSKSLGNSIDPLTIIEQFSADALRFSLTMLTATGQDVYISTEKFEIGRNFGTKLWNAARFMKLHSDKADASAWQNGITFNPDLLGSDDKHILFRLRDAVRDCGDNLEKFRFNDAAHVLYEFVWHQFCDWYVESCKETLYGDDDARRTEVLKVMHHVFDMALRLLHPIMPFVTEELWHAMGYGDEDDSIMTAAWPAAASASELEALGISEANVAYVDDKHDLIRVARTLRADYGISPTKQIAYMVKPNDADTAARLAEDEVSVRALMRAESLAIDPELAPEKAMPSGLSKLGAVYMPLEGLVDIEAEIKRLTGQLEKVERDLQGTTRKLENQAFVSKAPAEVVDKQRERKKELIEQREKLRKLVDTLSGMATGAETESVS